MVVEIVSYFDVVCDEACRLFWGIYLKCIANSNNNNNLAYGSKVIMFSCYSFVTVLLCLKTHQADLILHHPTFNQPAACMHHNSVLFFVSIKPSGSHGFLFYFHHCVFAFDGFNFAVPIESVIPSFPSFFFVFKEAKRVLPH